MGRLLKMYCFIATGFFILFSNSLFCQENKLKSYSWLYQDDGRLIANSSYKIDSTISQCFSTSTDFSRYLYNRVHILNKINPTPEMIENGESVTFILKAQLKKKAFSMYEIDHVTLADSISVYEQLFLNSLQNQLIGLTLHGSCGADLIYIHLPLKLTFRLVELNQEIGITKTFKSGWFEIDVVTNYVTDN